MLPNNGTNSNVVEIQQLKQQSNSTPSPEGSLEQKIELLGKEIKSLKKQNQLNSGIIRLGVIGLIGYVIATNWSTIAPATAATAAVPIAGIVIGAVVGAIVLVGASYAMWKYRAQIKEGFKYAAEKTVDGAKYIGGKIRDGAVYSKNKVKEGYEYSAASLERGVSFVGEKVKKGASRVTEAAANKLYNAAGSENYSDRINDELVPDSSQKKKIQEIKGDLKAIFADKGNNSGLVKNILSGISSKIDLKMAEEAKSGWKEYTPKWQVQKEFIHNLNEKSLYSLLTKRSLPKYRYFIDSVFSDHYDEIKEVIAKCKEDHILKGSLKMRNNMFEEGGARPSRSFSLPSFSSLGRKGSEQSNSLSKSNSLNSIGTESTAKTATVNPNRLRRSNSSSSLSDGFPQLTPVAPPKPPRSPSTDSGFNSPTSSPVHAMCADEDGKVKTQADLNQINHTLWVQPSTKVDEVKPESTQVKTVG